MSYPTTTLTYPPSNNKLNPPTLLDWLYLHDNSNIEPAGALIVYPRMIDRWNVASLILSNWEGYKVFVVTDHPNEFMETITNSHGRSERNRDWTDLELIPFSLIKYSDIAEINSILRNTEADIVLFDDARMLATISSGIDYTSVQPKIIILTSWGDTYNQLDVITSNLPNIHLLTLDIISDPVDIKWNVVKVPMSSRQLKFYDLIRRQELDQTTNKILYPKTRAITIYTYPDNISDELQNKPICEIGNKTSDNSWLNVNYLNDLNNDGPKLESIIDGIISNWPNKQIIFTRFNHLYGVDLITSFLQLMTQEKKNPYESSEIFHISCTDDYDIIINTLHKFNSTKSALLVTNIIPFIPLNEVSVLHVVDSYSFLSIKMIIDRCHKRYLTKGAGDFTIYSYVATHPNEVSSDLALYDILVKDIQEANRIYTGLINSGGRIVFNPNDGLLVI